MKQLVLFILVLCALGDEEEDAANLKKRDELMKERESLQSLLKTLHYSCIVLARMQLSRYGPQLMEYIESHPGKTEQNSAWKKIYTSHVTKCQQTVTYEDSVKIFSLIQSNEFEFEHYQYVYENVQLQDYHKDVIDLKFNSEEEKTWQYIQEFEKALGEKDEEEETNQLIKQRFMDMEPKVFGFSLKSSKALQYITFAFFFGVIGAMAFVVFKRLPQQESRKQKHKQ